MAGIDSTQATGSRSGRIWVAILLFGVAGYYGWARYGELNPPGINNGMTTEFRMPSATERKRLEAEFIQTTGLSAETVTQLRVAFESNPREAMALAGKTLTNDQKLSAGLFMMARMKERDQRNAKMLSEEDFKALKARRASMGPRRWWGAGNPGTPRPRQ
jgi:hypothetical protein